MNVFAALAALAIGSPLPADLSRNYGSHHFYNPKAFGCYGDYFIGVKRRPKRTSKRERAKRHAKCVAWKGSR